MSKFRLMGFLIIFVIFLLFSYLAEIRLFKDIILCLYIGIEQKKLKFNARKNSEIKYKFINILHI